ncbi:MAG: YbhB/YbcL family Raf kinase inhibitor-like protein [candidate division Zixibacteria bacterium]|nr:YbhB/YbcL family Raf kinase inhibitor-like protein [candidate division Zixibacteria bacterium]
MKQYIIIIMALAPILCSPVSPQQAPNDSTQNKSEAKMKITSTAFKEGEFIPVKYTCDGPDVSPPLAFSDIPINTKSLALICDDPDAPNGNWVHWIIYNFPVDVKNIPESVPHAVSAIVKIDGKEVALQHGKSSFGRYGYGGPCPPMGSAHHYYFKLYALNSQVNFTIEKVKSGITKRILLENMKGHIIAETSLMGKYQRK